MLLWRSGSWTVRKHPEDRLSVTGDVCLPNMGSSRGARGRALPWGCRELKGPRD